MLLGEYSAGLRPNLKSLCLTSVYLEKEPVKRKVLRVKDPPPHFSRAHGGREPEYLGPDLSR